MSFAELIRLSTLTQQSGREENQPAPRHFRFTCVGLLACLLLCAGAGVQGQRWVVTWQGSPTPGGTFYSPGCPSDVGLNNQTIRNIVHLSAGGDTVRVRLSNNAGANPLQFGSATISVGGTGAAAGGAVTPLHFSGASSILIAAGGEVLSDPIAMTVNPLDNLDISVYLPGVTGPTTQHYLAAQSNYLATGDATGSAAAAPFTTTISCWMFVSGVEVRAASKVRGTLVAFGDSITDGYLSTTTANHRYPDDLAKALAARKGDTLAVVNAGVTGNELLAIRPQLEFGYTAPFRFARDGSDQAGAKAVILLEGINGGCSRPQDMYADRHCCAHSRGTVDCAGLHRGAFGGAAADERL